MGSYNIPISISGSSLTSITNFYINYISCTFTCSNTLCTIYVPNSVGLNVSMTYDTLLSKHILYNYFQYQAPILTSLDPPSNWPTNSSSAPISIVGNNFGSNSSLVFFLIQSKYLISANNLNAIVNRNLIKFNSFLPFIYNGTEFGSNTLQLLIGNQFSTTITSFSYCSPYIRYLNITSGSTSGSYLMEISVF